MRLQVRWVDMRGNHGSQTWVTDVIDQDTDKKVGFLENKRSPAKRHVSLFGGKYQGDFVTYDECAAFAKGVEAVLNHIMEFDNGQDEATEAA